MAPAVVDALAFDSVSSGLLGCGQKHGQELEHDVIGGQLGNPLVEERHVGMVFGVSSGSGVFQ